mmetsp:Transcript_82584/g.198172  ORF Transcript_82584/g.198172 Transcript_82584/m.198172 type:complete len:229 (+) Transcript_82584:1868-2554(+)
MAMNQLTDKVFHICGVKDQILGLEAIIIFPSPAVDTPLDTIVEGDVVHGLLPSCALVNKANIFQESHQSLRLVRLPQRQSLSHLGSLDAILLASDRVEEPLRRALRALLVQHKANLLLNLCRNRCLDEGRYLLLNVHLAQRLIEMLHHSHVHFVYLLLVEVLDADLQRRSGILALADALQGLELCTVGSGHADCQPLWVAKSFVHIWSHVHVALLHAHVDLHQFLLQI